MLPGFHFEDWRIVEEGFHPENQLVAESLFALGNGAMGHRGSFEEPFSGQTMPGNYLAGLFYLDSPASGHSISGQPASRARLASAPNWIGLELEFDGEPFDLNRAEILEFRRVLNLREGYLQRSFTVRLPSGRRVQVVAQRFCSMVEPELGALRYQVQPLDFSGTLSITAYLDADVRNQEKDSDEPFWVEVEAHLRRTQCYLLTEIKQTGFQVCTGMKLDLRQNGNPANFHSFRLQRDRYVGLSVDLPCRPGDVIEVFKYGAHTTSRYYADPASLLGRCEYVLKEASRKGFAALLEQHAQAWSRKWAHLDVQIEGDMAAQQAMRFNLFHLCQSYTGQDERLNIGLRGFTGDKAGGAAYWFSDLFLPDFYLATGQVEAARNLLLYRYRHLPKAQAIAERAGFSEGAALFPMATLDGEEALGNWELGLEAIHRNHAVAYAIHAYLAWTGDTSYLIDYGWEVLAALSRFWMQRVQYSPGKKAYVILGVTGPNDYEVNVNNNFYTNYLASWCLEFSANLLGELETMGTLSASSLQTFPKAAERAQWSTVARQIYLPKDAGSGLWLQQDDFLEKEIQPKTALPPGTLPLETHWTWDRILRSAYIKHADVLLAFFLFEDQFPAEELAKHYAFYEPLTVHESSFSHGVHAVLEARLGYAEGAHAHLNKALLADLSNLHGDTAMGCHLPAMALAWQALIRGFAGFRLEKNKFALNPALPSAWKSLRFALSFRSCKVQVHITRTQCHVINLTGEEVDFRIYKREYKLAPWGEVIAVRK